MKVKSNISLGEEKKSRKKTSETKNSKGRKWHHRPSSASRGPTGKLRRDFLQGHVATGLGTTVLN